MIPLRLDELRPQLPARPWHGSVAGAQQTIPGWGWTLASSPGSVVGGAFDLLPGQADRHR